MGAVNQGVLPNLDDSARGECSTNSVTARRKCHSPQWDHPVEILFLDRPHKPLRIRIRVRALIRCLHDANPSFLEPFPHGRAPSRIAIADQHATRLRTRHRERPHDLAHKGFGRIRRGPKHLDASSREINDEYRVERHQAPPRPHLGREGIGPGDRTPLRAQKRRPRRWAVWRRRQILQDARDGRSSDLVAEILERTLNTCVVPRRILLGMRTTA